ncbi:unnamed protein product, partial [marine sediment metagenome]
MITGNIISQEMIKQGDQRNEEQRIENLGASP